MLRAANLFENMYFDPFNPSYYSFTDVLAKSSQDGKSRTLLTEIQTWEGLGSVLLRGLDFTMDYLDCALGRLLRFDLGFQHGSLLGPDTGSGRAWPPM